MPVIGEHTSRSAEADASLISALLAGLAATGFVEGQNVRIEYRWAHGKYDQLPALAAELVRMPVTVLVSTGGSISARAAKPHRDFSKSFSQPPRSGQSRIGG